MRRRAFLVVVVVLAACRGSGSARDGGEGGSAGSSAAPGETCLADADCPSGFCDRDRCASPRDEQSYGRACAPGVVPAEDPAAAKLHVCGAYLCRDGRCRSCRSDDECRAALGAPRCVPLEGRPGRRCGAGP